MLRRTHEKPLKVRHPRFGIRSEKKQLTVLILGTVSMCFGQKCPCQTEMFADFLLAR